MPAAVSNAPQGQGDPQDDKGCQDQREQMDIPEILDLGQELAPLARLVPLEIPEHPADLEDRDSRAELEILVDDRKDFPARQEDLVLEELPDKPATQEEEMEEAHRALLDDRDQLENQVGQDPMATREPQEILDPPDQMVGFNSM